MKATEISAPEREIRLCGGAVRVRFDHNQMRQSELYWQWSVGRRLGYLGIVAQMLDKTFIGLEAVAYGAVASFQMANGRPPITMRAFDAAITYDELLTAAEALKGGVKESMPKPRKKADAPAAE